MESNLKYLCPICGSDNVEIKVWMNPNTKEQGVDSEDDAYCNNCHDHIEHLDYEVTEDAS